MIHQHTKAEFVLTEAPSVPGDFGDNDHHGYDMVLEVEGRSADVKAITRLHVAHVEVPNDSGQGLFDALGRVGTIVAVDGH